VALSLRSPVTAVRALLRDELARGAAVNLGFTAVNTLLALVGGVLLARYLGPAGIGIVSLGVLVLEFGSVLDNIPTGGFIREYSQGATREKFATALALRIGLGLLTAALLALSAPFLAPVLDIPVYLLLLLALVPLTSVISSMAIIVWEARRNPWRRNLPGTSEAAVRVVLIVLALWGVAVVDDPILTAAAITVLASLAGALVGLPLLPGLSTKGFEAERARGYVRFGMTAQFTSVLNKVVFWIDILIIDLLMGHYTQGLYRTAYSVMAFVPLFVMSVGIFAGPSVSERHGANDHRAIERLVSRSFFYGFAIAIPLVVGALVFAEPVLGIFGPEFAEAAWVLRGLALVALLVTAIQPFEFAFPAVNRPGLAVRILLVEVIVNVALDLLLIPFYGVLGALIATAAAYVCGLVVALLTYRQLGYALPRLSHLRAG